MSSLTFLSTSSQFELLNVSKGGRRCASGQNKFLTLLTHILWLHLNRLNPRTDMLRIAVRSHTQAGHDHINRSLRRLSCPCSPVPVSITQFLLRPFKYTVCSHSSSSVDGTDVTQASDMQRSDEPSVREALAGACVLTTAKEKAAIEPLRVRARRITSSGPHLWGGDHEAGAADRARRTRGERAEG